MARVPNDHELVADWLRRTALFSAKEAADATGIGESTAERLRADGVRQRLQGRIRRALWTYVERQRAGEGGVSIPADRARGPERREVVANLLRAYRLRLWESAGSFAMDVFDAAVEQQRAEMASAFDEEPPMGDVIAAGGAEGEGRRVEPPPTPQESATSPARKRRAR